MGTKARPEMDRSLVGSSILERLRSEVAALEGLDVDLLRKRWRGVMGRPAPAHLSRALLLRVLAYRLQADALGEINSRTRNALAAARGAQEHSGVVRSPSVNPNMSDFIVKPGTLLAREYGGVMHRVMATEEGFGWNGKTFRSLSEVARAITGTK